MLLDQTSAMKIMQKYKIPFAETIKFTEDIPDLKYPVVLKVDSPQVIHKSDMNLVFNNLESRTDVREAVKKANKILKKNNISDYDLVLQRMIKGTEIIVGMKRDSVFGPVVLFGLGGIFVEVMKDFSMRVAPLKKKDCREMIEEIRGIRLIEGYRNYPELEKKKLVDLLMHFSDMSVKEKQLSEIDFNPVIANEKQINVVDARMISDKDV